MGRYRKVEQLAIIIVQTIRETNKAYPCYGLESYCEPNALDEQRLEDVLNISGEFSQYVYSIYHLAECEESLDCFDKLRELGRGVEAKINGMSEGKPMFRGLIFNFGIVCYAMFYIYLKRIEWQEFPKVVKILVRDLEHDFKTMKKLQRPATNGEMCYLRENISGARGTALQGYGILNEGLNYYHHFKITSNYYEDIIDFLMLNFFMSKIDDTSILRNNSVHSLRLIQNKTSCWMKEVIVNDDKTVNEMLHWNTDWRQLKIMPNGSRDMVICMKFLYRAIKILGLGN